MRQYLIYAIRAGTQTRHLQAAKSNGFRQIKYVPQYFLYHNNNNNAGYGILRSKPMYFLNKHSIATPGVGMLSTSRSIVTSTWLKGEQNLTEQKDSSLDLELMNEEEGDNANAAGLEEKVKHTKEKPLFTKATSLSELTEEDINTFINISEEDLKHNIAEGVPAGLIKEYEETKGSSLLVRASFLELRDELKAYVEKAKNPNAQLGNPRKQFILDGPVGSGKSITLAMLVHWARAEGWFVFYVPKAKEWTYDGFYYKHPVAPSWDTPKQAITVLERLLKSHENILQQLPCRIFEPITLGEGPGIGRMKDADSVAMPEASTLFDLVQTGLACSHAAVGVVVRLREELSLVQEVPVLFVIDQYNSWFTFSQYKEYLSRRAHRDIHARELTMVKPYRSMLHNDMMVVAYSHSTAVGKLRKHLPDTPLNVRYDFPRYSIDEAEAVINYYYRQNLISHERFSEEKWRRIYYLANGNGSEIRDLVHFI